MANAQWPPSLPQGWLQRGKRSTLKQTGITTRMTSGRKKARRRFSDAPAPWSLVLPPMTVAQVTTLEDFWENDLKGGTLPFDHVHPRTGAPVTFTFADAGSPPEIRDIEGSVGMAEATLELEIWPPE